MELIDGTCTPRRRKEDGEDRHLISELWVTGECAEGNHTLACNTRATVLSPPRMTTDELRAAAETRRELGRDYDEAILLSMADRLARRGRLDLWGDTVTVLLALGSIGLGILVALAAANLGAVGGTFATVVGWIAIALINVVHARSR